MIRASKASIEAVVLRIVRIRFAGFNQLYAKCQDYPSVNGKLR